MPAREIIERIDAVFPLERASTVDVEHVEPGRARYAYLDGVGDVGVIASVTEPFCDNCDRVRLTAEGQFRTCLFALDETDLRAVLRGGAVSTTRPRRPAGRRDRRRGRRRSGPATASARSTSSAPAAR